MEAINFIVNNWEALFGAVTSIVGAFAVLATITPNSADNAIMDKVLGLVNFLGANLGKSKNVDD